MNQVKLLNSIKDYLTRFQLSVKIANAESEYDINNHAENVLIPILNITFQASLRNANFEKKNKEAIDLIDTHKRLAIQVTSTSGLEKVKKTLEKFTSYNQHKDFDKLFVYILTEKQRSYSQEAINKILKKTHFKFNVKTQVIDATNLYGIIKQLNDISLFKAINDLLEAQFADAYISDAFSFNDFEVFRKAYKEKCLTNFSRLNFFGLSVSKKPREVELYSLFVKPTFQVPFERMLLREYLLRDIPVVPKPMTIVETARIEAKMLLKKAPSKRFMINRVITDGPDTKYEDFFAMGHHIVLLGNPGAGKSSMIKYTICKILERDESVLAEKDIYNYVPFRLELHKYNQAKLSKQQGLADFLVDTLTTEYQSVISLEKTLKVLTYFPVLLFFDGLDEIFDIQERLQVRNDIENFVKAYPQIRSVVTSRYESYEEVKLTEKLFDRVEIKNFDQTQLEDYVQKWYALEEQREDVRQEEIISCLSQLAQIDAELKFNPLLLSLIVILYRNELELPTNKLSIYESCTNTIVETRDMKEKKLSINLKISNKISVFSALAYWQFTDAHGQINNQSVQRFVKNYLMEKNEFQDEYLAGNAADEFLEFAKTRSIYFENKFTHKTFLEYFTAYYIFSKIYFQQNEPKKFQQVLDQNLGLSSWAVVLELLICKIDSNLIDYDVLDEIVSRQLSVNTNDAVIFFLQVVKYLKNVSETICIRLFNQTITFLFYEKFKLKESKILHKEVLFGHLGSLYKSERFKGAIIKAFTQIVEAGALTPAQINVFAHEFSIITKSNAILQCLGTSRSPKANPYIFILEHHDQLTYRKTYIETLKIFIAKFSRKDLIANYESRFGQPIFLKSKSFNWILNFVGKTSQFPKINEAINDLREIGISDKEIKIAFSQPLVPMVELHLISKILVGQAGELSQILGKEYVNKLRSELDVSSPKNFNISLTDISSTVTF